MNDLRRLEVMFEDMIHRFDAMAEVISSMQKDIAEMKPLVALIPGIVEEQKMFSKSIGIHSKQLHSHEVRISSLEAAT